MEPPNAVTGAQPAAAWHDAAGDLGIKAAFEAEITSPVAKPPLKQDAEVANRDACKELAETLERIEKTATKTTAAKIIDYLGIEDWSIVKACFPNECRDILTARRNIGSAIGDMMDRYQGVQEKTDSAVLENQSALLVTDYEKLHGLVVSLEDSGGSLEKLNPDLRGKIVKTDYAYTEVYSKVKSLQGKISTAKQGHEDISHYKKELRECIAEQARLIKEVGEQTTEIEKLATPYTMQQQIDAIQGRYDKCKGQFIDTKKRQYEHQWESVRTYKMLYDAANTRYENAKSKNNSQTMSKSLEDVRNNKSAFDRSVAELNRLLDSVPQPPPPSSASQASSPPVDSYDFDFRGMVNGKEELVTIELLPDMTVGELKKAIGAQISIPDDKELHISYVGMRFTDKTKLKDLFMAATGDFGSTVAKFASSLQFAIREKQK